MDAGVGGTLQRLPLVRKGWYLLAVVSVLGPVTGAADLFLLLGEQVLRNTLITTAVNSDWCPLGHLTREASSQADTSADLPAHFRCGHSCRKAAGRSGDCCISFLVDSRTLVPKGVNPEPFHRSASDNILTWVRVHSVCRLSTEMVSIACKSSSSISYSVSARAMRPRETIW